MTVNEQEILVNLAEEGTQVLTTMMMQTQGKEPVAEETVALLLPSPAVAAASLKW